MNIKASLFVAALTCCNIAHAVNLEIPPDRKFCGITKAVECVEGDHKYSPKEVGKVNGVQYYLYGDGSGTVQAEPDADIFSDPRNKRTWRLRCERDPIDNSKSCSATFGDTWLMVRSRGADLISVGTEHFPGSATTMRIGNRRFDTSDSDGDFPQSAQMIPLLKDGTQVATRYMKWPYKSWIDEEFSIHGAHAALQVIRWVIRNSK